MSVVDQMGVVSQADAPIVVVDAEPAIDVWVDDVVLDQLTLPLPPFDSGATVELRVEPSAGTILGFSIFAAFGNNAQIQQVWQVSGAVIAWPTHPLRGFSNEIHIQFDAQQHSSPHTYAVSVHAFTDLGIEAVRTVEVTFQAAP